MASFCEFLKNNSQNEGQKKGKQKIDLFTNRSFVEKSRNFSSNRECRKQKIDPKID